MLHAIFQNMLPLYETNEILIRITRQFEVEETYSTPRIDYDEAFLTSNVCLSRMYALGLLTMTYI